MNRLKIYIKASLFLGGFFVIGCTGKKTPISYHEINGETQGTTYSIIYSDSLNRNFKASVDSLLANFDQSLSTYIPSSLISQFNASDSGSEIDQVFRTMLGHSWLAYDLSEGSFDPSINPLLSYWGFNKELIENPDTIDPIKVESLLRLKGFETLSFNYDGRSIALKELGYLSYSGNGLLEKQQGLELNFNAIAQGYSVDLVASFLRSNGINNFMVEIGGETKVTGLNKKGLAWRIGVDKPIDKRSAGRALHAIIHLQDQAMATSGNYRKFYVKDGKKYPHTINPKTGFPVDHNLLSATVIADDCWMADAMATACLVNGVDWSQKLAKQQNNLEVLLIYDSEGEITTWSSSGFNEILQVLD